MKAQPPTKLKFSKLIKNTPNYSKFRNEKEPLALFDQQHLPDLILKLKRNHHLQRVSLSWRELNCASDAQLKEIASYLNTMLNLQYLSFDLKYALDSHRISMIMTKLASKSLRSIYLQIGGFTDDGKLLLKNLSKLKSLVSLVIEFSPSSGQAETATKIINVLDPEQIKQIPLINFKLKLNTNDFNDKSLERLGEMLPPKLRRFSLDIGQNTQISQNGFCAFFSQKFPAKLTAFSFTLRNPYLDALGYQTFATAIGSVSETLTELELEFLNPGTSNSFPGIIGDRLPPLLESLSITLDFKELNLSNLIFLLKSIKQLANLEKLELKFLTFGLNQEAIDKIATMLATSPKLKFLKLDFIVTRKELVSSIDQLAKKLAIRQDMKLLVNTRVEAQDDSSWFKSFYNDLKEINT